MRAYLLLFLLGQVNGQIYKAVTATRERKNILGPFTVQNQTACELACNCARGDSSGPDCAQFSRVVKPVNCLIYYYTASWCSFLGDYTENTCILPIVEYQLQQTTTSTTTTALPTTTTTTITTPAPLSTTTLPTTSTTTTTVPITIVTGVWSEWTTTGVCATTCGSCSNATRTRTCTGGPCEGSSDDVGPCGIKLCSYPAKPCCFNWKKTLRSNTVYCGPGGTYP